MVALLDINTMRSIRHSIYSNFNDYRRVRLLIEEIYMITRRRNLEKMFGDLTKVSNYEYALISIDHYTLYHKNGKKPVEGDNINELIFMTTEGAKRARRNYKPQRAKRGPMNPETKEKIRQSMMGHAVSEETKKKMSEAKIGKPKSDEHRESMRKARLGSHWYTDENGHRVWTFDQ